MIHLTPVLHVQNSCSELQFSFLYGSKEISWIRKEGRPAKSKTMKASNYCEVRYAVSDQVNFL